MIISSAFWAKSFLSPDDTGIVTTGAMKKQAAKKGLKLFLAFLLLVLCFPAGVAANTVGFTASPQLGVAPLEVTFIDRSVFNQTVESKTWDFGDGNTLSACENPVTTHTYQEPGVYTATLIYAVLYGHTHRARKTITVTQAPNQPSLTEPEDGTTGTSRTPMLKTGAFSDLDEGERHYMTQWQVSTLSDFSSLVLDIISMEHLTSLPVPLLMLLENTTYYWRVRFYDSNSFASEWSETFSFTTLITQEDQNANGIPDAYENSTVDLDNDGQADSTQSHIKSLNTAVGNGQMGVSSQGSSTITSTPEITTVDPESISNVSLPHSAPLGLFGMRLKVANPGDTAEPTVYFSQAAPQDASWYAYNSVAGWYDYADYATFSQDRKSVRLSLTDGGAGDADQVANGVIVDPSGFGIASWIKGTISDSLTDDPVTPAAVRIPDIGVGFSSALDGQYLGMLLPGTYDLDISAAGYESLSLQDIQVSEASITTRDVSLVKKARITGLSISGTQETFNNIDFTVDAESDAETLYYRFSCHPDYGTDGYDNTQWTSMTSTEWVTTSNIRYKFRQAGKYIVVVWVTTDVDNMDQGSVAIAGTYIEIGGTCRSQFSGFSVSGSQVQDSAVTISVNGLNTCTDDLYYRYSVHPHYGTSGYDNTQWTLMTPQEWSYNNNVSHTFTQSGKYIVVIWATSSLNSTDPTGIPILGWSMDIE